MVVAPFYIEFTEWADSLLQDFPNADIPRVTVETNWKEFARRLVMVTPFNEKQIPLPYAFETWRDWAVFVYDAMMD